MEETIKNKIETFLKDLNTEIDVLYMVDIDDIDLNNSFDSIRDMVENNNGFNSEIIYYSRAIEYLLNNDPSLRESLELAEECGFEISVLSSEVLASLLYSKNITEGFYALEAEITEFFEEIREEIENLEELEKD